MFEPYNEVSRKLLIVGIPTYKRKKSLLRLLESVNLICVPDNIELLVLIADNEGEGGEGIICAKNFAKNSAFNFPIDYVGVVQKGISYTRNAILHRAFVILKADYLAMVDDDETVVNIWIKELLIVQQYTKADLVGGLKTPIFESEPEPWMPSNDAYFYQPAYRDGPCKRLVSTDNLLITKDAYLRFGSPKFDIEFGLTGGGDTEFLHRLGKEGAKFAFSVNALSHEMVPNKRMTLRWARQRARRIGIGLARIHLLHEKNIVGLTAQVFKLLSILTISGILYFLFYFAKSSRIRYLTMCDKQLGKISGFLGIRVFPYRGD